MSGAGQWPSARPPNNAPSAMPACNEPRMRSNRSCRFVSKISRLAGSLSPRRRRSHSPRRLRGGCMSAFHLEPPSHVRPSIRRIAGCHPGLGDSMPSRRMTSVSLQVEGISHQIGEGHRITRSTDAAREPRPARPPSCAVQRRAGARIQRAGTGPNAPRAVTTPAFEWQYVPYYNPPGRFAAQWESTVTSSKNES